jgi:hypothetical protein
VSKIIEIIVSPNGQSQLKTSGFSGSSCQAASLPLEKALGFKLSEQLTPEFYAVEPTATRLEEGQ